MGSVAEMIVRALNSCLTLYMMLIVLRWTAPWLQIDLRAGYFQWVRRLADPLIDLMRRTLPPMGPFDFAPIAALFAVWLARTVVLGMMLGPVSM